jgi:uncharacterized membrane protein YfcA
VNFLNTAGLIAAGFCALTLPEQTLRGFAAADYFFLAGMAGVAFVNDFVILLRKTLSDRHRIAQHVWRMCIGFFIAAGSAFTGPGASIFPETVRNSGILSLPELTIIMLMLFWLFRILFGTRRRPNPPPLCCQTPIGCSAQSAKHPQFFNQWLITLSHPSFTNAQ